ncbi:MAG: hypothetical protein M3173_03555, partial [Chloroflexota bacterium]|nr:hypothetical protein [Chloroflexota bacterium]
MTSDRSVEPIIITSANNPAIRMMRSLERRRYRQTERAFLVEGRRLAEEALRLGPDAVRLLLVREDVPSGWWRELSVDASKIRRVDRDVFDAASGVEHAQG